MSHRSISVCGIVTSVLAASSVAAQDASTLEEVVVTAQKREQALAEVPMALQAFTGERLEAQGVQTAADALLQVPSASFQSATPTQKVFQMRGISQNAAVDPSVAFYVDEVPLGFPGMPFMPNIDALDLERIEVLRGPQGTLYGLGAMGGTVRVITADPSFSEGFGGRAMVEGGRAEGGDDSYLGSLAINMPLVDDKLAARIAASYRRIGGWIDDLDRGTENINDDDTLSVRAKLLYRPTDKLDIKLTFWRNEIDTKWTNQASFKNTTDKIATGTAADPEAFQDTVFNLSSAFVSYDLGFATLENGLSYFEHEIPARFVIGTGSPLGILTVDTMDNSHALTNELRLVSSGDSSFQWIMGAFYRDATRKFFQVGGFTALPSAIPPATNRTQSESISVFGEASYGFADDLIRVLIGARYFYDDRSAEEVLAGVQTLDINPTFDSFNPRVNITVKPSENLMAYLNAAKGFRSGIINLTVQTVGAQLDGLDISQIVDPDSVWTYEVGGKVTALDKRLFLEGAVYYSDWKDFQLQGASSSGLGFNINGGNGVIKGVEAGITWSTPITGLNVALSGSYVDAEFDEVDPVLAANSPLFAPGERLPAIPEWSGSLSVDYDTPLGATGLNLIAGGNYIFRDGQTDQGGVPGVFTDSREELSLRAGIRTDIWEITAFVNNLNNDLKSIASLTGTQWYSPFPRTVGLRLSANF